MKLKFVLKEEFNVDNEICHDMVEFSDKIYKEQAKKNYQKIITEAVRSGKNIICLEAKENLNDKKAIKLSGQTLAEAIFDIDWYFNDRLIDVDDVDIVIISEDKKKLESYQKACKKMGIIIS